jgi:hypothetical protein
MHNDIVLDSFLTARYKTEKKFEDIESVCVCVCVCVGGVIRTRNLKKYRQYNDEKEQKNTEHYTEN